MIERLILPFETERFYAMRNFLAQVRHRTDSSYGEHDKSGKNFRNDLY
jgi:hypothetical protein